MGQNLASRLNNVIENMITDDQSRSDIVALMASEAGIATDTVNGILAGGINCPPLNRLSGFAEVLNISESSLISAAELDGCEYSEERATNLFKNFWQNLKSLINRRIVDVDSWDGSPSRWPSTESYCNSCLINLNESDDPDEWTQGNCKLPVRNPGDSQDTFVRQAIFAAAARFNQVDAPEADKEAARLELLRAYDEMGEEPPEVLTRAISGSMVINSLWQKMFELDSPIENSDHYLVDIYFDDDSFYALYVDRGKLFRYDIIIQDNEVTLGERVEVVENHLPVESRTVIRQQADGRHRWFSISGTAVLNRSGEIDSRALFDSCIAYAQETSKYPIRMFYHQGYISRDWEMDESALAYKTGQADFLARDGFCYITSGLYDETELAQAEIRARQNNPDFWGDSIGFWPTQEPELVEISDGIRIPVYQQGFNVEITTLPESDAAHLFTRTEVTRMTLNGREWDAFVQLWDGDEEKARQWLEANPQARNRAIEEAGIITRDLDLDGLKALFKEDKNKALEWLEQRSSEEDAGTTEESTTDDNTQETVIEVDDSIIEVVMGSEGFTQLSDNVTQVSDRLTEIETQLEERSKADSTLITAIERLTERLNTLEKGEATIQQQIANDKPAKFNGKMRIVHRPRQANAALQEDGMPYNEKAKANLPKDAY